VKSKTTNAWLITWESSRRDYLTNLARPRIVCILSSRIQERAIRRILPALYLSESRLTLSEKLNMGTKSALKRRFVFEQSTIQYGDNPWLLARRITSVFVREGPEGIEELHWQEPEEHAEKDGKIVVIKKAVKKSIRGDSIFGDDEHFIGG
jgi:hypothetical protein